MNVFNKQYNSEQGVPVQLVTSPSIDQDQLLAINSQILQLQQQLNEQERVLAGERKLRRQLGKYLIAICLGFCVFIFFLQLHPILQTSISYYTLGAAAFIAGSILMAYMVYLLEAPVSHYGITSKNLPKVLGESALISSTALFICDVLRPDLNIWHFIFQPEALFFYAAISFLQEFIFRAGGITISQKLYNNTLVPVLMTSFLFSVLHIHSGFLAMALSFLMGLLLAMMFLRHRSIWGITLIHIALGSIGECSGILY